MRGIRHALRSIKCSDTRERESDGPELSIGGSRSVRLSYIAVRSLVGITGLVSSKPVTGRSEICAAMGKKRERSLREHSSLKNAD